MEGTASPESTLTRHTQLIHTRIHTHMVDRRERGKQTMKLAIHSSKFDAVQNVTSLEKKKKTLLWKNVVANERKRRGSQER